MITISGCASSKTAIKLEPASYKLEYHIVNAKNVSKSLNIRVALININNPVKPAKNMQTKGENQLDSHTFTIPDKFINSLMLSIETILANKGYFIVDTFNDLTELTEDLKKNIDFLVIPSIALNDVEDIKVKSAVPLDIINTASAPGKIECSGSVNLIGKLSFTIVEPITNDIIYIKKKKLKESSHLDVFVGKYVGSASTNMIYKELFNRCLIAINNARGQSLEEIYAASIKIFNKHFPEGKTAKKLNKKIKAIKAM
jgi:hypothetical protein